MPQLLIWFDGSRTQFVLIGACVGLFLWVVELIRRRKLKESFSIIWFSLCVTVLLMSIRSDILILISRGIGIEYVPATLFLVAIVFVLVVLVHFSVVFTKLDEDRQALIQEVGLLRLELEQLRKSLCK